MTWQRSPPRSSRGWLLGNPCLTRGIQRRDDLSESFMLLPLFLTPSPLPPLPPVEVAYTPVNVEPTPSDTPGISGGTRKAMSDTPSIDRSRDDQMPDQRQGGGTHHRGSGRVNPRDFRPAEWVDCGAAPATGPQCGDS